MGKNISIVSAGGICNGKKKIAISIFLIAFASGLSITGIAPILGILKTIYATRGTSGVQILQTLQFALVMVGSLLVGWLTTKLTKKNIATIGLTVVGICGAFPFFFENYDVMLIFRFLIGFGFGIISPIITAIVAEFFKPEERAGYFGLNVIGMGVGSMAGNFFGGILANIGYRYFYLVYLIAFISMVGIRILLPDTPLARATKKEDRQVNKKVYLISASYFVYNLFITAYSTNIAIYILEKLTANTAVTGAVTAVNAAFALLIGAAFAGISKLLKRYTLPVSIIIAAVGYAAIICLPGFAGVYVGSACCGISLSCFMARSSLMISTSVEPQVVAKASGIFSVSGGIGGLISPIFLGAITSGIFGSNTASNQFLVSGIGMTVLAVVVFISTVKPAEGEEG